MRDPTLAALEGALRGRWRADGYDPLTGTCVDLSGEGNHLLQATESLRPDAGTANGRAAMVFAGTEYLRRATFVGGAATQPTSIFAVANRGGADSITRVICDGGTAPVRHAIFWNNTNVWQILAGTIVSMSGGNAAVNTVSAFACTFNGASSVGLFDDWDTNICPASTVGANTLDGFTLGAAFNGTIPWVGTINEIIVVQGATAGDGAAVREYFRQYYGLSFLA